VAPFEVALNSHFFLPTVNGCMAFSLRLLENCSVHPQDMSSTYLSGFGHTSPLSRNGFPYVASARQASSRTRRVSVFLFQDDRLFSAQMCASCSVIYAHTEKALNRTGLPVLPDCCNHTAFLLEPRKRQIMRYCSSTGTLGDLMILFPFS
jgi:hypothetical protein